MKIQGFDEFQKKFDQIAKNVAALDGRHEIPITELLTPAFLSKYTSFSSADELFEQSGYKIESPEDFAAIPEKEWDKYIRSISSFSDCEAMLSKASEGWAATKMGF